MNIKALLFPRFSKDNLDLAYSLRPDGVELEYIGDRASDENELASAITKADVLMGFVNAPLPPRALEATASLKLLQVLSAGYDKLDLSAMRRYRVPVANNGGANSTAVAEHAILLMLAAYRDLVNMNERVKSGGWRSTASGGDRLYELEGKTVGIVGLGMIGRQVAKRLRAFEAKVQYYDLFRLSPDDEGALGVTYVPLADLLRTSDVVTLHLPLSSDTHHIVGKDELETMKRSAVLINTCRGGVVDNQALSEALRDGVIAAAGLDTFEPEPPPADSPLLKLKNVTVTPHSAGPTVDSFPKRFRNGFANVQRVAAGEKPLWIIPEMRDLF
ncbi:MAG: 2-hydroxyacid dehydrogenase [Chloroflexota bacterium]